MYMREIKTAFWSGVNLLWGLDARRDGGSEGIEAGSRTVEMRRAESVREAERLLQRAAAGPRGINFNDLALNGSGYPSSMKYFFRTDYRFRRLGNHIS